MRVMCLQAKRGVFDGLILVKLQYIAFTAHSTWMTLIRTYKHARTKLNKMVLKILVIWPSMEKNSLWHFTSGNGIKFMVCFPLISVRLLYMLFQLSRSITIMWDFIFHLWKKARDTETIKGTGKIKTDFWLWWATRFGVRNCEEKYSTDVFIHWLILTFGKKNLMKQFCLSLHNSTQAENKQIGYCKFFLPSSLFLAHIIFSSQI